MISMRLPLDLTRLRRRYIARHTQCRFPPMALAGAGDRAGHVEDCVFTRDALRLRGQD